MSKQMSSQFEKRQIEHDIEELQRELERKKKQLHSSEEREEKEILHEVIGERINRATAGDGDSGQQQKRDANLPDSAEDELPDYIDVSPPQIKNEVHRLIHLAFEEGLEKAAHTVQKHDGFVIDAFHDALVDKVYEELKKKEIIK